MPGEEPFGAPGHFGLAFWQSNRSAKMLAQRCWESGYCTKSSCNVSTDQQRFQVSKPATNFFFFNFFLVAGAEIVFLKIGSKTVQASSNHVSATLLSARG